MRGFAPWLTLAVATVGAFALLGAPKLPTDASGYASWAQAILSAMAIVAAVLIARDQHLRERAQDSHRLKQVYLDQLETVSYLLSYASNQWLFLPSRDWDFEAQWRGIEDTDAEVFDATIAALERFGPSDVPAGQPLSLIVLATDELRAAQRLMRDLVTLVGNAEPDHFEKKLKKLHQVGGVVKFVKLQFDEELKRYGSLHGLELPKKDGPKPPVPKADKAGDQEH